MRGFCGQRKTDAYAWAAADAKPTPMRGPRPTQNIFKKKKINICIRFASNVNLAWAFTHFGRRE